MNPMRTGIYSWLVLTGLALACPAATLALELTAGNTAVGTSTYPFGVADYRRVAGTAYASDSGGFRCSVVDPVHGYVYFGTNQTPGRIHKIRCSDLAMVDSLTLPYSEYVYCATIDLARGYAYFGLNGSGQGHVVKLRLSDFTIEQTLNLEPYGIKIVTGAIVDHQNQNAYFASCNRKIAKVRLSDFQIVGALELAIGEEFQLAPIIDPSGNYLYALSYNGMPGGIVKIRLSDFTRMGALTFQPGEDYPISLAMDPAGIYAYAGTMTKPGIVIKIRLADLTQVASMPLYTNEDNVRAAIVEATGQYGYFATYPNTGSVIEVRLSDFTRVGKQVTNPQTNLYTGAYDPASNFVYFGIVSSIGYAVKMSLKHTLISVIHGTRITLGETAKIKNFKFYSHQAGGHLRLAIYDNSSVKKLVWQSPEISNSTTAGWLTVPVTSGTLGAILTPGTYWLAFNSDSYNNFASYTPGATGEGFKQNQDYAGFPNTLPSTITSRDDRWSMYLTYDPVVLAAPAVPTGLTAMPGAVSIALRWNANTEPDIQGYRIYRDSTEAGAFQTVLNDGAIVTGTAFEDNTTLASTQYYYRITAVNTTGGESPKSPAASATTGAIVVTMSDIRAEAGTTVSLPINCAYATGITGNGMDIKITYDQNLLTPVRANKTILTQGFNFFDNIGYATGQVNISGISAAGATIRGEGRLLDVDFVVKPGAQAGATGQHTFYKVKLYDGLARALSVNYSDTAAFTVGTLYARGDVNGDGDIDSGDALLAQQAAVGLVTLNAVQQNAADVSGDGEVDSADVTLILRLAVGMPVNPPVAGSKLSLKPENQIVRAASNLAIWVVNKTANTGTDVTIPVYVNNLSGVAGCKLQINFNPAVLELSSVSPGPAMSAVTLSYKSLNGVVVISFSGTKAPAMGQGVLANLQFKVVGVPGRQTYLTPATCKLNGSYGENLAWTSTITMIRGLFTANIKNGAAPSWVAYP